MFGKLKEKLKSWTKGLSKKAEESEIEEKMEVEEAQEEKVTKPEKKPKKTKEEKHAEKESKREEKRQKKEEKKKQKAEKEEPSPEPKYEETETVTELIETPKKFNNAIQGYEPDLEKIEEIEEDLSKEPEKQKKSFFGKLTSKINKVKISENDFNEYSEDLEMLLLENNVALEVAEKIIYELKLKLVGKEILKKELESEIKDSFRDAILKILVEPFDLIEKIKLFRGENEKKPYIILFCGINGTGKTTSIAKLAYLLKKNKLTSVMAAGDTFRAASIEQLNKHGEKLDTKVISHEYGSDPASVGFDAIKYAEKNNVDVVLIDTAGRMHTEKNLMMQIEKVAKVTKPDTKIFVGESITGNDIVEQVKAFNDSVQIDGIILSKADIDEKGGTALSVGATTGKPILFLGTGQDYKDFEPFDKNKFIEKLGLDDD